MVNDNKQTAQQSELAMSVTFTVEDNRLRMTYEVQNNSCRDVFLLNRLYRTVPFFAIDPNIVYVCLEKSSLTAHLIKKIPDLPAGKYVTSPMAPFVTPVRAGEKFSETLYLSMPVTEYRQYSDRSPPTLGSTYKAADFTLGYYWAENGTTEETKNLGGAQVVMPRMPPGVRPSFGELKSKSQSLCFAVLEPVPSAEN
jgi:hypothetical protein